MIPLLMLPLLFALLDALPSYGQYGTWYFGDFAGLSFASSPPTPLTDGQVSTLEGCAVICNERSGEILFYTDGVTVWNARHEPMPNGTGLSGHWTSTQSAIIVPLTCSPHIYYVFTTGAGFYHNGPINNGFRYSIVDMSLDGGLGDVIEKNTVLLPFGQSSEAVAAVYDQASSSFWVLAHGIRNNSFYAYHLSQYGISAPVVSQVGSTLNEFGGSQSIVKFSPNGRMVALTTPADKRLDLFDFDITTGRLRNMRSLGGDHEYYGVEFSPDGSMLYTTTIGISDSNSYLFQFDLSTAIGATIKESQLTIDTVDGSYPGGQCQLGPDEKIYVSYSFKTALSVINDPNASGLDCDFIEDQLDLGGTFTAYGLPNMISSYRGGDRGPEGLTLELQIDTTRAKPGDTIVYTLIACNTGNADLINTLLRLMLPSGLTPLNGSASLQRTIPLLRAGSCDTLICIVIVTANEEGGDETLRTCGQIVTPSTTVCLVSYETRCAELILDRCDGNFSVEILVDRPAIFQQGNDYLLCGGSTVKLETLLRPKRARAQYRWTPAEGVDCDTCPATTADPTVSTQYIVTVIDPNGCLARDTVNVIIVPGKAADAGPDRIICLGSSAQIGTSVTDRNLSIHWSPSAYLNDSTADRPIATPPHDVTYRVTIVDTVTGCISRDTVTISVVMPPSIDGLSDQALCLGDSLHLRAGPIDSGYRFRWTPSHGLDCDTCAETIARPTATTSYIVTATNAQGCAAHDTVTVAVLAGNFIDAGEDHISCIGHGVRIGAVALPGLLYFWTPADGLDDPTAAHPMAAPLVATTYIVRAVDTASGCEDVDTVHVDVAAPPSIDAGDDARICSGKSIVIGEPDAVHGVLYRWTPTEGLDDPTTARPTARPLVTTTYRLHVLDTLTGCEAVDTVRIDVTPTPLVDGGSAAMICLGGAAPLGGPAIEGIRYEWTPVDGLDDPYRADPKATPQRTTLYLVRAVDDVSGCAAVDSVLVTVEAAAADAGRDTAICAGESVRIGVRGQGSGAGEESIVYRWTPTDGLDDPTSPAPIAEPSRTTLYRLTAIDTLTGCAAIDSVTVAVTEPRTLHAWIDRDYHGPSGEPISIAVESDEILPGSDIDSLELTLSYDAEIMRLDDGSIDLSGTPLEGWAPTILDHRDGTLRLRAIAPPGLTLDGGGELLRFDVRMFLSRRLESELGLDIIAEGRCLRIVESPGLVRHDTLCGLNFRLIELSLVKYAAPRVVPNPARGVVSVEFGIGLDGATRLEIYDAMGRYVGTLVEGELGPGAYSVEWDVSGLGAGAYHLRLRSGAWEEMGRVVVE